jgi:hypothetical protein
MVVTEIQEPLAGELGAIVRDDVVGNPKAMDDVGDEQHGLLRPDAGDGSGLDPLGKFVNGDEQVGEAPGCFLQGSDQVEPPDGEWPSDGDGLQGMSREMGLPCVVLAYFAGAYQLNGVKDRGWPIEALPECVSDKGSRRHMMTASPQV